MRMNRFTVMVAVVVTAFLTLTSYDLAHARGAAPAVRQDGALPEGEGKAVVEKVCTTCHGLDYLVPSQRTVQVWGEVIDLMRAYGAEATDEQWKTITDYIVWNLAYLNVNKAAAQEFGMVFRVDDKTAQGVVAFRETQGGFKTIDDLKKAPGLDGTRVDALQARLTFE